MSEWHKDIHFAQRMRPFIDSIYERIFDLESITRITDMNPPHPLDKHFGIDGWIELKQGCILTIQEKMRRYNAYIQYRDFTLELWSNEPKKVEGEWYHLASELYFYGYSNRNETEIIEWHILRVLPLKLWIAENFENWEDRIRRNVKHSKASFFAIPWQEIPKEFILKEAINFDREKLRGTVGGVKEKTH